MQVNRAAACVAFGRPAKTTERYSAALIDTDQAAAHLKVLECPCIDTGRATGFRDNLMKHTASMLIAAVACIMASPIFRAAEGHLDCTLRFTARQWSPLRGAVTGTGMLMCTDGSAVPVIVDASGPGITAERWNITDGWGVFDHVTRMEDALGRYTAIEGDIGVSAAGTVQTLTKGKLSLGLSGKGKGFVAGIAIRNFSISRAVDRTR